MIKYMRLRLIIGLFVFVSFCFAPVQYGQGSPHEKVSSLKLQSFTQVNSNWKLQGKQLVTVFKFKDGFKGAVNFVQKLVKPADAMNHHPDVSISYNKVTISLTTHDAGGITHADLALAEVIQKLYAGIGK